MIGERGVVRAGPHADPALGQVGSHQLHHAHAFQVGDLVPEPGVEILLHRAQGVAALGVGNRLHAQATRLLHDPVGRLFGLRQVSDEEGVVGGREQAQRPILPGGVEDLRHWHGGFLPDQRHVQDPCSLLLHRDLHARGELLLQPFLQHLDLPHVELLDRVDDLSLADLGVADLGDHLHAQSLLQQGEPSCAHQQARVQVERAEDRAAATAGALPHRAAEFGHRPFVAAPGLPVPVQ